MECLIARHPVFDRTMDVQAYNLDIHTNGARNQNNKFYDDQELSKIVTEAFIFHKIETLTNNKPARIQFSKHLLLRGIPELLPNKYLEIVIASNGKLDSTIHSYCEKLIELGYTLILDNFCFRPDQKNFLDIVHYIRVDSNQIGNYLKRLIPIRLKGTKVKCIAGNIQRKSDFAEMFDYSYDFFDGDFFIEHPISAQKDIRTAKSILFHILNEVNRPELDYAELEKVLKQDISLSFKLFKLVNSAAFGLKNEIVSIRQALTLLGKHEITKWMSLLLLANLGSDQPLELLNRSLVRAKFLESLAVKIGFDKDKENYYLTGLFSLLDIFIGKPLSEILEQLPIAKSIKSMLLGEPGPTTEIFDFIIQYEKGNWAETGKIISKYSLSKEDVSELYLSSVNWAQQILTNVNQIPE